MRRVLLCILLSIVCAINCVPIFASSQHTMIHNTIPNISQFYIEGYESVQFHIQGNKYIAEETVEVSLIDNHSYKIYDSGELLGTISVIHHGKGNDNDEGVATDNYWINNFIPVDNTENEEIIPPDNTPEEEEVVPSEDEDTPTDPEDIPPEIIIDTPIDDNPPDEPSDSEDNPSVVDSPNPPNSDTELYGGDDNYVGKSSNTSTPKTGDSFNLKLVTSLLICSLCCLGVIAILRKYRK